MLYPPVVLFGTLDPTPHAKKHVRRNKQIKKP